MQKMMGLMRKCIDDYHFISPGDKIAVGVSGAVHHIVGMKQSGTVIAVNPDRNAPIFEYADYGILSENFLG